MIHYDSTLSQVMEWWGLGGLGFFLVIIYLWNRMFNLYRDWKREDAEKIAVMDQFLMEDAFEDDDLY